VRVQNGRIRWWCDYREVDWRLLIARPLAEEESVCVCMCVYVCVCEGHEGADCDGHALLQQRSWGFVTA